MVNFRSLWQPEHGALFRRKGGHNWHKIVSGNPEWRKPVALLFNHFVDLTPGARVEQKEWGVAWHYRGATSSYQAQRHLKTLKHVLKPIAKEYDLQIIEGHKVLEVRPTDVHKGRVATEWVMHDYDFVFSIGDDVTDEDMFAAVPPGSYTVKVGSGPTLARFRLPDVIAALKLLEQM